MERVPVALVAVFLASAAVAVASSLSGRRFALVLAKPLTTALLLVVAGPIGSRLSWLIHAGIVFSLAGDTILLFPTKSAFLVGLGIFLLAHLAYIVGFVGVAGGALFAAPALVAAAVVLTASAFLLRRLWPGVASIRVPLVAYAIALSVMVTTAVAAASAGGPQALSPAAAVGAALFFVGDASLALDHFHARIRYAPLLTLGVYWLGQLGIALGARWAG